MNSHKEYYRKRVKEYEEIYHRDDPIRLQEQQNIINTLKVLMKGKIVLEFAAGTGYWTQFISETAFKIIASDSVREMLDSAKLKHYKCNIEFKLEDAYNLSFDDNQFEAGVANFWFSHIPKEKINIFLKEFHKVLKNNAIIFIADNVFNKGIGGELIEIKNDRNSYKLRQLSDGIKYNIIKNYYHKDELSEIFNKFDNNFSKSNIYYGKCFWFVYYYLDK